MTEDEARTKWCPFMNVAISGLQLFSNRGEHGTPGDERIDRNCIASKCMAWRQQEATVGTDGSSVTVERKGHGFCGLAGKP